MANKNRYFGELETDVYGKNCDQVKLALFSLSAEQAAAADATGVHAAITGNATIPVVTTANITNPPCPRNLTVTPGGTTADVKADSIVVKGTNIKGEVISENFTFAANASEAVEGTLAFKTVTSITIPPQDGAAATFAVGYANKIGLPFVFAEKPLCFAYFDGAIEGTAPSIVTDAAIAKNTIKLSSSLNAKEVRVYLGV